MSCPLRPTASRRLPPPPERFGCTPVGAPSGIMPSGHIGGVGGGGGDEGGRLSQRNETAELCWPRRASGRTEGFTGWCASPCSAPPLKIMGDDTNSAAIGAPFCPPPVHGPSSFTPPHCGWSPPRARSGLSWIRWLSSAPPPPNSLSSIRELPSPPAAPPPPGPSVQLHIFDVSPRPSSTDTAPTSLFSMASNSSLMKAGPWLM
ncbi:hypothetical protein Vretimale_1786 [Volvox reticuliferus]|uniref:Uncharacterized protein n=1 Tax=Volvox reticuliferus TaxID=1737510 RepID=A0A8J4CRL7_9CHLO|nr:hypothetical protein Vretifemale_15302 [Volvox reticuliferus]GIL95860.1 hypothetical protein Vretimale_1786 [Volvox reticuliferus]